MGTLHQRKIGWDEIFATFSLTYKVNSKGKYDLLCPFHEERTPSFRAWPGSGLKCHGCGECGSKRDFVEEMLRITIKDSFEEFWEDRGTFLLTSQDPNQLRLFPVPLYPKELQSDG